MANGWSHPHGKTGSDVVPSTWQPTPQPKTTIFAESAREGCAGRLLRSTERSPR